MNKANFINSYNALHYYLSNKAENSTSFYLKNFWPLFEGSIKTHLLLNDASNNYNNEAFSYNEKIKISKIIKKFG
ncbi:MAG: hypothetical protein R2769_10435 [Saprospiraceae bacterium]